MAEPAGGKSALMAKIGYTLSSGENSARALVEEAVRAEQAGFAFAGISDQFHPWLDCLGQSPFVWGVIGGIARATESLELIADVACPTRRLHPAVVAHAAATAAAQMPGRFSLGLGSGENSDEHILGDTWPSDAGRQARLEEAIGVIRLLWDGGLQSHHGRYYTIENARLYSLPPEPPPILVAVAGEKSVDLAGRMGDGLIGTAPVAESIERFRANGGEGKPTYGQLDACLEVVAGNVVCGPDPQRHLSAIREYVDAGYDHVYVHQVGPEQASFFELYEREILPQLR